MSGRESLVRYDLGAPEVSDLRSIVIARGDDGKVYFKAMLALHNTAGEPVKVIGQPHVEVSAELPELTAANVLRALLLPIVEELKSKA